jgi:hypothetical protein
MSIEEEKSIKEEFFDTSVVDVGRGFSEDWGYGQKYKMFSNYSMSNNLNRFRIGSLDNLKTLSIYDYSHMYSVVNMIGIDVLEENYDRLHEMLHEREALDTENFRSKEFLKKVIRFTKHDVLSFYKFYADTCAAMGMSEKISKNRDFFLNNFHYSMKNLLYKKLIDLYSSKKSKQNSYNEKIELKEEDFINKHVVDEERAVYSMQTIGMGPEFDKNFRFMAEMYNTTGKEQVFDSMQAFAIHTRAGLTTDNEKKLVFLSTSGDIQLFDYDLSSREYEDMDDREEYYTYIPFMSKSKKGKYGNNTAIKAISKTEYLPTSKRPFLKNKELNGVMCYSLEILRGLIASSMNYFHDIMDFETNKVCKSVISDFVRGILHDDERTLLGQKGIKNDTILLSKNPNSCLYYIDCENGNIVTVPAITPKSGEEYDSFHLHASRYEISDSNFDEKDYIISIVKNAEPKNGREILKTSYTKRTLLRNDKKVKRTNIDKDGLTDEDMELVNNGFGLFFRDKRVAEKCYEAGGGTYEGVFAYCCRHKVFNNTMRGRLERFKFNMLDKLFEIGEKNAAALVPILGTVVGLGVAKVRDSLIKSNKKTVEKVIIEGGKGIVNRILMPPIARQVPKEAFKIVSNGFVNVSKLVVSLFFRK